MAPYLAVFVGQQGGQIVTSLFTTEEFYARAQTPGTKWATLLSADTGVVIDYAVPNLASLEKTS